MQSNLHDTSAPTSPDEYKERTKRYFEAQKSLFASQTYSDWTVRCGERSWSVHKAIICPQSRVFAKAANRPWREEDEKVYKFLDNDEDPEIVEYALRFMYEQDYTVLEKTRVANQNSGIRITDWLDKPRISRGIRRRLQHGITHVNNAAMLEAHNLILALPHMMPNTAVANELSIAANRIDPILAESLLDIFEKDGAEDGDPWYIDDYDNGELIHAKLYKLGDYLEGQGLSDLALHKLFAVSEATFDAKVCREAVDYILDKGNTTRGTLMAAISRALETDMDRFGYSSYMKDVVDKYPVLKEYIFHACYHDDVVMGTSWGPLAKAVTEVEV